jgi:hypothetical protein
MSRALPALVRLVRAAVAGALLLGAPALAAQEAARPDQLVDRQLAYNEAKSTYQSALDARLAREKQWNDAIQEHDEARRAGDTQRQNAALIRALDLSRELDQADKRATASRRALDAARRALLAALEIRMESISGQLAGTRSPAERASYGAVLRDLDAQQRQLEAERDEPAYNVQLVYYPSIQYDVRDTPETLVQKAQLLRAKVVKYDSSAAQIDREIDRLDRQLRSSRNAQSLVSGLERFGDVQPPGAPTSRSPQGDVQSRPDSAGVSRPEASLQQRIQALRILRLQVLEAKRQFLQRAGVFEQLARRTG